MSIRFDPSHGLAFIAAFEQHVDTLLNGKSPKLTRKDGSGLGDLSDNFRNFAVAGRPVLTGEFAAFLKRYARVSVSQGQLPADLQDNYANWLIAQMGEEPAGQSLESRAERHGLASALMHYRTCYRDYYGFGHEDHFQDNFTAAELLFDEARFEKIPVPAGEDASTAYRIVATTDPQRLLEGENFTILAKDGRPSALLSNDHGHVVAVKVKEPMSAGQAAKKLRTGIEEASWAFEVLNDMENRTGAQVHSVKAGSISEAVDHLGRELGSTLRMHGDTGLEAVIAFNDAIRVSIDVLYDVSDGADPVEPLFALQSTVLQAFGGRQSPAVFRGSSSAPGLDSDRQDLTVLISKVGPSKYQAVSYTSAHEN